MSPGTRSRTTLRLETLEDRLALSWAGVPPAQVRISNAPAVSLNSHRYGVGFASITRNEVDPYYFVAPASGTYRFNVSTPSSNLDSVLGVYNSSGQRLAYNDDVSYSNFDSQLHVNLTAGQRYFFCVSNYTGSGGGSYTWSIQGPAASASTDDGYENNDSFAGAYNLGTLAGRRTIGGLVMADTADWFRFTQNGAGTSSDYVSIAFTHSRGDLDLRVYNAAGTLVRYSDGITNSERVSLSGLGAGTYYVQVYGYRGVTNPSYSLDIDPGTGSGGGGGGGGGGGSSSRVLYLNFDGANISRSNLVRWAGSDWAGSVNEFDADRNGISVGRFLPNRADREQVIARMLQLIQQDLAPFGVTVQRHTGLAVEGVGATTIFLGRSTLSSDYYHVACDVDIGNRNRTDIAFVGNEESWGSVERTALAMADVTLHEAGHTWGLWHVASGSANESMGLRYNTPQSQWVQNTAFLDRTFAAYSSGGYQHGPGPQNSFQTMRSVFGGSTANRAGLGMAAQIDTSHADLFTITTSSAGVDQISIRRLSSGNLEVMVNGRVYELSGYRRVQVNTSGDRRDQVRVLNDLRGVRVTVNRAVGAEIRSIAKHDARQAYLWATGQTTADDVHGLPAHGNLA